MASLLLAGGAFALPCIYTPAGRQPRGTTQAGRQLSLRSRFAQARPMMQTSSGGAGDDGEPDYYANPLTKLLGQFLPGQSASMGAGPAGRGPLPLDVDWDEPKVTVELEEMVRLLDDGIREREWFVSGRVIPSLFADDFR